MKKRFSMLPVFAFVASMFMLSACGDDDDSGSTVPQTPSYKIKKWQYCRSVEKWQRLFCVILGKRI